MKLLFAKIRKTEGDAGWDEGKTEDACRIQDTWTCSL